MLHKISLYTLLLLFVPFYLAAQNPNTVSAAEIEAYQEQCRQMVQYLEGTLNFLGEPENVTSEKEIIINESYLKVFKNDKVQIEDDLDQHREVSIRKDVQAYLKDLVFFYKQVKFSFHINTIDPGLDQQGALFFKISLNRNLKGITVNGDTVDNNQLRYIEINVDPQGQGLKIASIYTHKPNESIELQYWWKHLSQAWKDYFGKSILVYDSVPLNEIQSYSDTGLIVNYQQATGYRDPILEFMEADSTQSDSIVLSADSLPHPRVDTLYLDTHLLTQILKQLRKAKEVDISGNLNILDLDALSDWPELISLRCAHTLINDLSPLRSLNKLEVLDITGCPVSSLKPLLFVSALREIDASHTPMKEVSVIANLKKLETLNFANTLVDSLPGFGALQNLRTLELNHTPVHRIDSLASLGKLLHLNIANCMIDDFSPLNHLRSVQVLNLDSTNIQDLGVLDSLQSLKILQINGTKVKSLLPLAHLNNLKYIYCDYSGIHQQESEAFNAIQPHCQVIFNSEKLEKWWNGLSEAWKKVFASYVPLKEPVTKEQLHQLLHQKKIDIAHNQNITSLNALSFMTQIETLNIASTPISDLSPLSNMSNLRVLIANHTHIRDLGPLKSLKNLKKVDVDYTTVSDLLPLMANSNLSLVYADHSKVGYDQAEALQRYLPQGLVVYQTAFLRKWWKQLDKDWQTTFAGQIDLDDPPTREQLQQLVSLKKISIRNKLQINTLDPLRIFSHLSELYIDNVAVTNISPLYQLKHLSGLSVRNSPLTSIEGIDALHALKKLDLENTSIEKLDALQDINRLHVLNIAGTKVKSLKPIQHLFWLQELYINNTRISSLKALDDLHYLKLLRCNNSGLKEKKVEAFKKSHPNTKVIFY